MSVIAYIPGRCARFLETYSFKQDIERASFLNPLRVCSYIHQNGQCLLVHSLTNLTVWVVYGVWGISNSLPIQVIAEGENGLGMELWKVSIADNACKINHKN